jgi:hypothetical protein
LADHNRQAEAGNNKPEECSRPQAAEIEPVIAMGRQPHHPPLAERFVEASAAPKKPMPVAPIAIAA